MEKKEDFTENQHMVNGSINPLKTIMMPGLQYMNPINQNYMLYNKFLTMQMNNMLMGLNYSNSPLYVGKNPANQFNFF